MQLNPARGRKHYREIHDSRRPLLKVYAAQPREGTETKPKSRSMKIVVALWFMQLNPARGRKPYSGFTESRLFTSWFMQLNPARGRKLGLQQNVRPQ